MVEEPRLLRPGDDDDTVAAAVVVALENSNPQAVGPTMPTSFNAEGVAWARAAEDVEAAKSDGTR